MKKEWFLTSKEVVLELSLCGDVSVRTEKLPGPPIPLEFLLIKKISTYILRIEKFTSMNGKNRRIRIFSSIVMWPCGVVCAYIMFDLPLNATECQKNAN